MAAASEGLDVRFSIYFHGSCVFPHIKTVYVRLCHRVMDCTVLSGREERGEEGKEEGEKEGGREEVEWCAAAVKDMAA